MGALTSLGQLSLRSNIETYLYDGKYIIVYDDHRCLLNVLFEAFKLGMFTSPICIESKLLSSNIFLPPF